MEKRSKRLHLAVTPSTKRAIEQAARRRGVSLSEFVRRGAKLVAFEALTELGDEENDDE